MVKRRIGQYQADREWASANTAKTTLNEAGAKGAVVNITDDAKAKHEAGPWHHDTSTAELTKGQDIYYM